MISFASNLKAFVCEQPVHMRSSFNALSGMVRNALEMSPTSPYLFVFFNKNRNQVKILYWDRTGYAIWAKRLETGRFCEPKKELDYAALVMLLEGVVGNPERRQKRFKLPDKSA